MNNSTIDKKIGEIKTRVDTYQGEFWDILMDLIFNPDINNSDITIVDIANDVLKSG